MGQQVFKVQKYVSTDGQTEFRVPASGTVLEVTIAGSPVAFTFDKVRQVVTLAVGADEGVYVEFTIGAQYDSFKDLVTSVVYNADALGTTQSTATPITAHTFRVDTADAANKGLILPVAEKGSIFIVRNSTAQALDIYPPLGEQLNFAGANVPSTLGAFSYSIYVKADDELGFWIELL